MHWVFSPAVGSIAWTPASSSQSAAMQDETGGDIGRASGCGNHGSRSRERKLGQGQAYCVCACSPGPGSSTAEETMRERGSDCGVCRGFVSPGRLDSSSRSGSHTGTRPSRRQTWQASRTRTAWRPLRGNHGSGSWKQEVADQGPSSVRHDGKQGASHSGWACGVRSGSPSGGQRAGWQARERGFGFRCMTAIKKKLVQAVGHGQPKCSILCQATTGELNRGLRAEPSSGPGPGLRVPQSVSQTISQSRPQVLRGAQTHPAG